MKNKDNERLLEDLGLLVLMCEKRLATNPDATLEMNCDFLKRLAESYVKINDIANK